MVAAASPPYTNADWQLGYESLKTEYAYWVDDIEGTLPAGLQGTYFRNGPGLLDLNGQRYGHPFDGDGMIVAITFDQGRVHFANRFVRTPEYVAEQKAGKILYRSVFGTQRPGGWWANLFDLKFKNPANTHVIYQGHRLLALWEGASPYRLDPKTLETLGVETFSGAIYQGQCFTAHPKIDPVTGDLLAFGVQAQPTSKVWFYRISAQGHMVEKVEHTIPGFAFLHDFVWTPNYRLFFQNPVSFDSLSVALGFKTAGACLNLDPKAPTRIRVFPQLGEPVTLETDPGFIFHFVNGYEAGDQIIVDAILYQDFPPLEASVDYREVVFEAVPPGKLYRYTINLASQTVQRQLLLDRSVEFPSIHPQKVGRQHRYIYTGTTFGPCYNAPLQAILKFDTTTGEHQTYSFAPKGYSGEPIFIPNPAGSEEDSGWLMTLVFDASVRKSAVVILDAQRLDQGPIAKVNLKHHVPYGLHGMFTPEVFQQVDS